MIVFAIIGWLILLTVVGTESLAIMSAVFWGSLQYDPLKMTHPGTSLALLGVVLMMWVLIVISCPIFW